tara:strand:- start:892 stop:1266 length:375 start_codon:yes stop_codon:yes gene_type:complete
MSNFWINSSGENTLKGSYTNPSNLLALPDEMILDFLKRYPKAREDFHKLLPSMLPEEQARLEELTQAHPSVFTSEIAPQEEEDNFQSSMNRVRINNTMLGQLRGKTQPSNARSGLRVNTKPLMR